MKKGPLTLYMEIMSFISLLKLQELTFVEQGKNASLIHVNMKQMRRDRRRLQLSHKAHVSSINKSIKGVVSYRNLKPFFPWGQGGRGDCLFHCGLKTLSTAHSLSWCGILCQWPWIIKGRGSDGPTEACLLHMAVLLVPAVYRNAPAKVLH